jgi:hypothetical protein
MQMRSVSHEVPPASQLPAAQTCGTGARLHPTRQRWYDEEGLPHRWRCRNTCTQAHAYLIAVERVALVAAIVMRRTPWSGRVGVSKKASAEAEMQARAAKYGTIERISLPRSRLPPPAPYPCLRVFVLKPP